MSESKTWKELYAEYLQSDDWKLKRSRKLRMQPRCEKCNTTRRLQVHHLNYRDWYSVKMPDLQVLCRDCHRETHGLPKEPPPRKYIRTPKQPKRKGRKRNKRRRTPAEREARRIRRRESRAWGRMMDELRSRSDRAPKEIRPHLAISRGELTHKQLTAMIHTYTTARHNPNAIPLLKAMARRDAIDAPSRTPTPPQNRTSTPNE